MWCLDAILWKNEPVDPARFFAGLGFSKVILGESNLTLQNSSFNAGLCDALVCFVYAVTPVCDYHLNYRSYQFGNLMQSQLSFHLSAGFGITTYLKFLQMFILEKNILPALPFTNDYLSIYADYRSRIDEMLLNSITRKLPATLYEPLNYALNSGGKRIRPMMVIFSCETAGGSFESSANAAVALEMLHNFTLVHDDIMDNADTRRGELTIYKKWDCNVAILAGDQLIGLAYVYLLKTQIPNISEMTRAFTDGIIEVCEGQSYDKEFEARKDVSISEYMLMISKKTAKMLETSAAVGALIGGAENDFISGVKEFALNIGLAFQIQDDLLDIVADEADFGKKIGGDIIEGKKTYLLLKAFENTKGSAGRKLLEKIINSNGLKNAGAKEIEEVRAIYEESGAVACARNEIAEFTDQAMQCLEKLPDNTGRQRLKWLAEMLMNRKI